MRHFYSLDAEAIILKELFDPSVRSSLMANNIDVGKISKSDTGNHQASDRSPVFRDCKTGLKVLTEDSSMDFSCNVIEKNVKAAIKDFNKTFASRICSISSNNIKKNRRCLSEDFLRFLQLFESCQG